MTISKTCPLPPKHVHCVLKFYFCDLNPLEVLICPKILPGAEILMLNTNACIYSNLQPAGGSQWPITGSNAPVLSPDITLTDHLPLVYY